MKVFGSVLGVFATVALFVGLCIGGYQLYWHVAKSNVQNQYDVNTNTQQWQAAKLDQLRNLAHDATLPGVPDAQKQIMSSQFCSLFQVIKPAPPANGTADLATDYTLLCQ